MPFRRTRHRAEEGRKLLHDYIEGPDGARQKYPDSLFFTCISGGHVHDYISERLGIPFDLDDFRGLSEDAILALFDNDAEGLGNLVLRRFAHEHPEEE